ncbi:MAG: N-acetyl-gamma-glutamyl-phosphate reductase [Mycobacterium sp.]
MSLSVAVAGASGYAGGELLRLLAAHPDLDLVTATAHSNVGQRVIDVHPHLHTAGDLEFTPTTAQNLSGHDVVFIALPHGASGALTDELGDAALVVDCGADHRLTDEAAWDAFYGGDYKGAWAYGMPELQLAGGGKQRELLRGVRRIAVPGCNATAVTLGLAPGIHAGVIEPGDVTAALAVGTSGAGKALHTHLLASEIHGSAFAYAVGGTHRHTPEILQNLVAAGGADPSLSFTPMLVPMSRGILATATAKLVPGTSAAAARAAWQDAYAGEEFVALLPEGKFPRTADTVGANIALVGLAVDEAAGRVVTVTALDNLVKGTAGAAIQSTNIALGLPERSGLQTNGVAP